MQVADEGAHHRPQPGVRSAGHGAKNDVGHVIGLFDDAVGRQRPRWEWRICVHRGLRSAIGWAVPALAGLGYSGKAIRSSKLGPMASSGTKGSLKAFVIWLRKKIPNWVLGANEPENLAAASCFPVMKDVIVLHNVGTLSAADPLPY